MTSIFRREEAFVAKNARFGNARFGNSAAPRCSPGALLSRWALGGCLLGAVVLASPQAFAAIKTVAFNAVRPDDGDLLNFRIAYDDAALIPSAVGALCGPDPTPTPGTTPPPSSGCYVQNTSNGYLPGPVAPSFQGYEIVKVTGTYYDKVENKTFNVTGLYSPSSFEGGVGSPIPHYASDNLFDPALAASNAISAGGLVVATDNPAYQYHLFWDAAGNDYAGCGSGTCKRVQRVPGPLPVAGALAAFGFSRKLRRRAGLRDTSVEMA